MKCVSIHPECTGQNVFVVSCMVIRESIGSEIKPLNKYISGVVWISQRPLEGCVYWKFLTSCDNNRKNSPYPLGISYQSYWIFGEPIISLPSEYNMDHWRRQVGRRGYVSQFFICSVIILWHHFTHHKSFRDCRFRNIFCKRQLEPNNWRNTFCLEASTHSVTTSTGKGVVKDSNVNIHDTRTCVSGHVSTSW